MNIYISQKNPVSKTLSTNSDWQSKRLTPVDRLRHMLVTSLYSDVEFLVGDERKVIKAHKNFLAMTSPVFETMFFGSVPQPQPVLIPDIEPLIFNHLLHYMYTDVVIFQSVDHADWLHYAANKYMLPILSNRCIQYVTDNLSPKNVFRTLEFGINHNDDALKEKCFALLRNRARESYKAAGFEKISESTLLTLVQMDALDINEIDLFHAVNGWASLQCITKQRNEELSGARMRKVLNKVIGHIRFLAMTPEEFASAPARSGILTESECLAIFLNLNSREQSPLPSSLSGERKLRGPRAEKLRRDHRYESWYY